MTLSPSLCLASLTLVASAGCSTQFVAGSRSAAAGAMMDTIAMTGDGVVLTVQSDPQTHVVTAAVVAAVSPDSRAARRSVEVGDPLYTLNGQSIGGGNAQQVVGFDAFLRKPVNVGFVREQDTAIVSTTFTVAGFTPSDPRPHSAADLRRQSGVVGDQVATTSAKLAFGQFEESINAGDLASAAEC